VLTGLALNCRISRRTRWDRKSYYYPDMPKNYQITQYDMPIAGEGHFEIPVNGTWKRVRIRRAHLEEDAGKNIHDTPGCTLVDLNRAGTPLLEIVTEPDLAGAEETYKFCVELQRLVTYLGVSEGNMKKGQMRFEPNVNLAITCEGREYRTPITEIKNLNSFRAVRDAIAYEANRQAAVWRDDHDFQQGKRPNENRGWNAEKGITEYQRGKEEAHDYRYFPDPDLVPVDLSDEFLDELRSKLPELPLARRGRFVDEYGLSPEDAATIVGHRATADLFEQVLARVATPHTSGRSRGHVTRGNVKTVTKQFLNVWLRLANDRGEHVTDLGIPAGSMAELAGITADGTVNKSAANRLAEVMVQRMESRASPGAPAGERTPSPMHLAEELGIVQVQDTDATEAWIDRVFAENQEAVRDALTNPKKAKAAAGFLLGQVMKLSGGRADPALAGRLIEKRLSEAG
jgi:aspartyl-tRNA(Asn)/glutamyl-tRNA(Gln) amidotransferase subunit B